LADRGALFHRLKIVVALAPMSVKGKDLPVDSVLAVGQRSGKGYNQHGIIGSSRTSWAPRPHCTWADTAECRPRCQPAPVARRDRERQSPGDRCGQLVHTARSGNTGRHGLRPVHAGEGTALHSKSLPARSGGDRLFNGANGSRFAKSALCTIPVGRCPSASPGRTVIPRVFE
jgi:hypothetical protein